MKQYEVVLAPAAYAQARKISAWWRENRPSVPDLFDDEIGAVLERLANAPKAGLSYLTIRSQPIRRLLMARSSYNVYFETHEERTLVRIVAVWHAARGRGPRL